MIKFVALPNLLYFSLRMCKGNHSFKALFVFEFIENEISVTYQSFFFISNSKLPWVVLRFRTMSNFNYNARQKKHRIE